MQWFLVIFLALVALAAVLYAWRTKVAADARVAQAQDLADHYRVHDELTGLLNRSGADVGGQRLVELARRDGEPATAAMVRIWHHDGRDPDDDDILSAAEGAAACFRASDVVARVSPDLFLVVGKGPGFRAAPIEERLESSIRGLAPAGVPLPGYVVGVSILDPWDEGDLQELERRARADLDIRLEVRGPSGRPPTGTGA